MVFGVGVMLVVGLSLAPRRGKEKAPGLYHADVVVVAVLVVVAEAGPKWCTALDVFCLISQ